MIYDDLTYRHEADIFANQQKYVKNLLPYEVFMANLEAGNSDQLMIRDLVESYGLEISNKKGPSSIVAVSTLEQVYKKIGYHGLNRVLRLIIGAWEGDANSFSANMLNAVAKLVEVYGDRLDEELYKEKLGAVSIKQLTRNAKDRRSGSMGFAEAMIIIYNGKKKSNAHRLYINKLYAHGAPDPNDAEDDETFSDEIDLFEPDFSDSEDFFGD